MIKASQVLDELPTEEDEKNSSAMNSADVVYMSKNNLPADKKEKVEEAEAADKARPESEKLQDKADQLEDEIDSLTKQANKLKADLDKKAKELEAKDKNSEDYKKAQTEFEESYEVLKSYAADIDERTNEFNQTLKQIEEKKIKPKLSLKQL